MILIVNSQLRSLIDILTFCINKRSVIFECYLIYISDGLWDVLSNEAAVAAMRNVFSNSSKSAADVAGDMLDIALRRGAFNRPFRLF